MRVALLVASCLAALFPATARAQIDLPQKPRPAPESTAGAPVPVDLPEKPRGRLLERMLGKDPYDESQAPADKPAEKPGEKPASKPDDKPIPKPSKQGSAPPANGGLDLPSAPAAAPKPAAPPAAAPSHPEAPAIPSADAASVDRLSRLPPGRAEAAAFIVAELRRTRDVESRMVEQAATSLAALEDAGRQAARVGLQEEHPPLVVACARVLLASSDAADRELVLRRLRSKLPNPVCGPLVDTLVRVDPVDASPKVLCELLDHPQQGVRAAAQRALEAQKGPALLPYLTAPLASERTDTRLRALALVDGVQDPSVLPLLLERLKDRSAQVASRAADMLATLDDSRAVKELLGRAFGIQWILRDGAYAILALVEREDLRFQPILDEHHVDALLGGLAESDPFVSGACAAALAGIGFRSANLAAASKIPVAAAAAAPKTPEEDPAEPAWLDRDVPHVLVRAISGVEYHNDFSSLQEVGVRRLSLISGESFGNDGPAWLAWWKKAAPDFKARRSVITAKPEDAPTLSVAFRSSSDTASPDAFRLLAPQAPRTPPVADAPSSARPVEELRISAAQARDLLALFEREGALGAQRLPGARGATGAPGRTLEITIAGRAKSFHFPWNASEPWFDKLAETALSLRDRNRWQRYPDPLRHASGQDLWLEQASWWDEEHGEVERDLRLASLVLQALPLRDAAQRETGLAELERLYARPEVVQSEDLPKLLDMLKQETFVGPRARSLHRLLLAHVRKAGAPAADGAPQVARSVVGTELDAFGERGRPLIAEVLAAAGPEAVRAAAADPRPLVRATATACLAKPGEPLSEEDLALVVKLLDDPESAVESAAARALGDARVESARTELLVRARLGSPPVRAAAIEACAKLGGEGALDVLVLGLADNDPGIKLAAAHGLALLRDPTTAPLLVSLLAQGSESPLYASAREGLLALGEQASPDLLRAMLSPSHRARREATLLLAAEGVPQSAPVLMTLLTENPADAEVAGELAVLTCVDMRSQPNPSAAWWDWWEGVVHEDSLAWLRAALERAGVKAPEAAALKGEGTREGAEFLLDALARPEPFLAERGRRELGRRLGRDLGALPPAGPERTAWTAALRDEVERRWK